MEYIRRELLEEAGYDMEEMSALAPSSGEMSRLPWRHRPEFVRRSDGRLFFCTFRCLSSWLGGGTCNCISHRPERWAEVIEVIEEEGGQQA